MPTLAHSPIPFDPKSTEHLPRRRVRLVEELHGPWVGVPEAWRDALSSMPRTAWTVGQRLLELAGKRVARWRWQRTLRELAQTVGQFVGCSARTFWTGWKLLRERGFVIEDDDGWRIASENGSRLLVEQVPAEMAACCKTCSSGGSVSVLSEEVVSDEVTVSCSELVKGSPSRDNSLRESSRLVNSVNQLTNSLMVNHARARVPEPKPESEPKSESDPRPEPAEGEITPDRQELIDRLWGRTPERIRERRQAQREYERKQFDRQQERDRQREVIGSQRRGFTVRWRDLLQAVRDRWGPEAIERLARKGRFKEGQELQQRIAAADIRGSDEAWARAVEVLARRREEPGDPFSYFAAVLERLAAEEDEVRPLGELATPVEFLNVGPECVETAEQRVAIMRSWVELATKR